MTNSWINFWIGHTPKHVIASEVCAQVLFDKYKFPVYRHAAYFKDKNTTNPFSRTRFTTPLLDDDISDSDWVFYCDDDFLFLNDPRVLLRELDDSKKVYVCKHDYTPKTETKLDGEIQNTYERKNWSSFMIFNKRKFDLKMSDIFEMSLMDLHQFRWCDDKEIGEIHKSWNWLVGEYEEDPTSLNALHYTLGGPWYEEQAYQSKYNDLWLEYKEHYFPEAPPIYEGTNSYRLSQEGQL